ncbi:MAG: LysR family transcriptional regulator [Sphingomonadales bacterium]|nr:MAG: LysR family transcriptional regulator [Sphingomonadales bacterium]
MESLRQLKHVIALAEHRHFGRAADFAGITQAALTQSIQKLEETYGVSLFDRRYGDVIPTAYGEIVLDTARKALSDVEHMHREIDLTRNLASGRLIVGCHPYFSEPLLAPALSRLLGSFPNLAFTLEIGGWEAMETKLLGRKIDLYIGFANDGADARIEVEGMEIPPFIVFCRSGHPLADKAELVIEDMRPYPKAVAPPSRWFVKKFLSFSERSGISGGTMIHNLTTSDMGTLRRLVAMGDVLGVAMRQSVQAELESGQFRRLMVDELEFDISIVFASEKRRSLPPAALALLNEIRAEAQNLNWARNA